MVPALRAPPLEWLGSLSLLPLPIVVVCRPLSCDADTTADQPTWRCCGFWRGRQFAAGHSHRAPAAASTTDADL